MLGLFKMIGEVAAVIRVSMDSTHRRERYELVLDKKAKKALDSAETIIHGMDSFLNASISEKQFRTIFKKHRRRFFAND